jgi:hypothetical protein
VKGALGGAALALALVAAVPARPLAAQRTDTLRAASALPIARPDTAQPVKPVAALWRSLLLPGWGQAITGRDRAGAAFAVWEGVTVMMTVRAAQERRHMEEAGSANVGSKRQQVQDWIVLWVFNHLFAGADAFVGAHLQDFPGGLKLEALPGGLGVRLRVP